jgi:phospholipid/cholesterol/gamma-HCH transport system substrate-binding protein
VSIRPAMVGAFVIGGVLLFATGLFLIGDRRMLFSDTFEVYAEFAEVAALDNGAKVRVAGMDAGEVENIRVPTGPRTPFRVRMRVREDLHPLIRLDSIASIQNDGLVGNKFVQIDTGSEQSPEVPDKGTIKSREPFDIADLMQKMSDTIDTANTMLADVKSEIEQALAAVSGAAGDAQTLMNDVGKDVRVIMASSDKVTRDLSAIVGNVRAGKGTVGKLLNDDALYGNLKGMMADAEKAIANVRQASEQAREAIADFRGEGGPVKGVTGSLQQTLASARDAMSDLAENTEALKRSFFFRGFFNKRGYFDLDDVSPAEYRQGALRTRDRRVLKIWLTAAVLFDTDPNGSEQLTDGGRTRLDSAMSQFVRFPRTSPLVVEAYAQEVTADAEYLAGRRRAQLVRDYLVGKFSLDPNYVATMPMGAEAKDSPAGNRWNGVALALFVPATALQTPSSPGTKEKGLGTTKAGGTSFD